MTLSARTVSVIVGLVVFAVFFPALGVGGCSASAGCTLAAQAFWGLPLPPDGWASVPAFLLAFGAGWATYRKLQKP